MKYKKEQIMDLGQKYLSDTANPIVEMRKIDGCQYFENKSIARPRGHVENVWIVYYHEPVFDCTEFLVISDNTGEPLYYQTKHQIAEVLKDANGRYSLV